MGFETIEHNGVRYAEIIWADTTVEKTTFFSPSDSSFQFGLLAHEAGFIEPAHYHRPLKREVCDLQQMFLVQRGAVAVQLFDNEGKCFKEILLRRGDAIVLVHGTHAVKALEDMQCVSVKQGPFLGPERDKVIVETRE